MMTFAPPIDRLQLEELYSSSDTDTRYQNYQPENEIKEELIHFVASSKTLIIQLNKTSFGYWTAMSKDFAIYGDGDTGDEAIRNYLELLLEYYIELQNEEEILGPFLQKELENLRRLIA